jgi:hypothetical protein
LRESSRGVIETGDGIQQLAAMPDGSDPDVLEILSCQPRQHLRIDSIVAEGLLILP